MAKPFKTHDIVRSNPKKRADYHGYKDDLIRDFGGRCAYCNLHQDSISMSHQIDHFIPQDAFKGKRNDLLTDYGNLVLACGKCNRAKGSKFDGDISLPNPKNERFYDPVETDYNTIFFRNDFGCIASHDPKGQQMITDIGLYRPIHIWGWVCEALERAIDDVDLRIDEEEDESIRGKLSEAAQKMKSQYIEIERSFRVAYKEKDWSLELSMREPH